MNEDNPMSETLLSLTIILQSNPTAYAGSSNKSYISMKLIVRLGHQHAINNQNT